MINAVIQEDIDYCTSISPILTEAKLLREENRDLAIETILAGLKKAKESKNPLLFAALLYEKALYIEKQTKNYQKIFSLLRKAAKLSKKLPNSKLLQIKIAIQLGMYYAFNTQYYLANKHLKKAVVLLDTISDQTPFIHKLRARAYISLSNIYRHSGNKDTRIKYTQSALELYEKLEDKFGMAICYDILALILPNVSNTEQCIEYFDKSIALHKETNNQNGIAHVYRNKAMYYYSKEDYTTALELTNKAFEIYEEKKNKQMLISVLINRAKIYTATQNLEAAILDFQLAQNYIEETSYKYDEINLYLEWSNTLEQIRDFKGALIMSKKYIQLLKYFEIYDKKSLVKDIQFKHKVEFKQYELDLLRKKNEEIHLYAKQLKLYNDELKQISHLMSHDLKEHSRLVNIYAQRILRHELPMIHNDQKEDILFAVDTARKIYDMVHSVSGYLNIPTNIEKVENDLPSIIHIVHKKVAAAIPTKLFTVHCDTLESVYANEDFLTQILYQIIHNAVVHSLNDSIEVLIKCSKIDTETSILISDNGPGIDDNYKNKIFDTFYRLDKKNYHGPGIGLAMVRRMMEIQGGKISVLDNKPNGTIFELTFPI